MPNENTPGRVNPFADLDDFKPKAKPAPAPSKEVIDKIAEETGFVSRQAKPATSEKVVETPKLVRGRRYVTGRNQQLNIKVTEDTLKRFYTIADEMKLPLGEVFERALKALEDTK